MIRKVFCCLAFLLLMLQCIKAEESSELNCGTETPAACKEQFKEKFSILLDKHYQNGFPDISETLIQMVKNASSSEQQTEETIRAINNLNQQVKSTSKAYELTNLLVEEANAVKTYFKKYHGVNKSSEVKNTYLVVIGKIFKGLASDAIKLFDGLRPQDYEEFERWQFVENKFKDEFQNPNSFDPNVMEKLVNFLRVRLED